MELKDTVCKMESPDYKDRFYAEYWQLKIRCQKLHKLLVDNEAGNLDFTLTCPVYLLKHQESLMWQLLCDLEIRAEMENISLEEKL